MGSRRAADLRFLLPGPPRSVALLGTTGTWAGAWAASGIDVVTDGGRAVDVVVSDRWTDVPAAAARARGAVVLLGWPALPHPVLRGWTTRRYSFQGAPASPRWLVGLDPRVRRHLARTWSRSRSVRGRVRNRALSSAVGTAAGRVLVATREQALPHPLEAAVALGLPAPAAWAIQLGDGDDLQRAVAFAFPARAAEPDWVLKFSRVAGAPPRGEREREVLGLLTRLSPRAAARATAVLGSLDVGGSLATVERAAPGSPLAARLLEAPQQALRRTGEVVDWVGTLTADTLDPGRGASAVQRLVDRTLVPYRCVELATRLDRTPAVLAHNDLGSWNILDDGRRFTVVDWESAEPLGLPLWDVAYFATDALSLVHGPAGAENRVDWCRRLWRGELEQSRLLADWCDAARRAAGLGRDAAAASVTACWLHHGLSRQRREAWVGGLPAAEGYLGRLAHAWLRDPGLGVSWTGFRDTG